MRSLPALFALFLLAGCATAPQPYVGKDYSAVPPVRLNVSAVLVDNAYTAPGVAPNVDHLLHPTPAERVGAAITAHYPALMTARSRAMEARFVIQEASVTETPLPLPAAWLDRATSKDPEFRYEGRLVIEAKASGRDTRRTGFAHVEVTRTLDVPQISAAARDQQIQGLVAQMVDDAMAQLDQQLDANFGSLIYADPSRDTIITPQPSGRWDHVMTWQ